MPPNRRTLKTTFAGGELSDSMEGRVDVDRYSTSVQKASNFFITRFGAASNRPGTTYVGKSASDGIARIIPFEFSVTQTYFLEFTDDKMRVIKDGSIVLTSRRSATYKWTASGSGTGEYYLELAAGGNPSIPGALEVWENGSLIPTGTLGSLTASTWNYGDNDSLGYSTIYVRLSDDSDPDGKAADYVQSDYQLETNLASSVLDQMTFAQSADTLFLAGAFFPQKVVRTADDAWTIGVQVFAPTNTAPVDIDLVKTGLTGTARQVLYKISARDSDNVESLPSAEQSISIDLNWPASGGRVDVSWNSIRSTSFKWTASGSGTSEYYCELAAGGDPSLSEPSTVYVQKVALTEGTVGSLSASEWDYGDNDSLGYNTIYVRTSGSVDPDTLAVGSVTYKLSTDVQWRVFKNYRGDWGWVGDVDKPWFLDDNVEPSVGTAPKEDVTPFDAADSNSFPYAVGLYQQRLHYARTNTYPQTVWSSVINDLTNYSVSRPVQSDDRIQATLQSGGRVDEIRHLVPLDKFIVLTTGSEWTYGRGSNSDALTPFSVQFEGQGFSGCSTTVQPLNVENKCVFVQRNNRDIRSLQFDAKNANYLGSVITYFVPHLFEGRTIVDWCYQQHPDNLLWLVLSDGALLSCTYIPEQKMVAFCRHDTDGKFEACASITTQGEDQVLFIIQRTINGSSVRYLETLSSREFTHVRDCKFVDSGIAYDPQKTITNVVPTATEVTVTIASHGYSNDDYVLIDDVVGLSSTGSDTDYSTFNGKYYQVKEKDANTFKLGTIEDGSLLTTTEFTGTYVSGGICRKTALSVSGADHLEGESVAILADGQVLANKTVVNGTVTLTGNAIGYGVIRIGLGYVCDLQTLRLEPVGDNSIQGQRQRVFKVWTRYKDSSGGKIGPDASNLVTTKWRQSEEWREPNAATTDDKPTIIKSTWNRGGRILFRQDEPLPSTIQMFIIEFEAGGL